MDFIITEKPATICLNMIVKNEAHIILNTLTKLCDKIKFDYWVICDTGSTDETPTIITEFFEKRGIKGELFFDEWVNFAHNRTLALERAYKKTDLLLVFDADDEICGNIVIPKEVLHDEYQLKFGSNEGVAYIRVLLINNHKKFEYKSVVHEFICSKEPNSRVALIHGDYYVVSGRAGSRNKDPEKYLKDAQILEKAHADAVKSGDLLFHRYAFYCANSYKDYGDTEQAIKWYKIVLSQEGQWAQEKYMSCLYLGENYDKLGQKETGFFYLIKAFQYDTERVECLFPLLVHYCCENMSQVAYHYYLNVKEFYENQYLNTNMSPTKLFLVPDKYNFFVPYYMILIGDKVKDYKCVIRMYEIVFIKKQKMFVEFFVKNLLYNLQFFFQHVSKENTQFVSLANDYIRFLYDNNVPLHSFDYLLTDVYKNAGIITDYIFVKEVTNKPSIFSEEECAQSKNVLIYTGFCDLKWNYSYALTNALGGSEKAAAYLSQHLSKDCTIYVSGSVKEETIDNIHYVHLNELTNLINTLPFHTVIVSRYVAFYEMFPQCSFYQSFIWAHDTMLIPFGIDTTLNEVQIVKKWNKYIKGCVCLTEWHKNLFLERYSELKDKIHLINNGIELSHFCKEDAIPNGNSLKVANRFIYTSRPDRGLNILVALWPTILEKLPGATLVVSCYGDFPSNQTETDIKETMDKYDSIQFLGKLDSTQLYKEMASAEYWLYPTSWPETSCITALEMLMSEVICIYYPVAGLTNTLGRYGIQVLPEKEIETIVSLTEEKKSNLRKEGRLYAESCSWANRGKMWNKLLFPNKNNKKTLAIFNSFSFHYEMFGFILNFAKRNDYAVDIYTNFDMSLGWIEFYKNMFQDVVTFFHFNGYSKTNKYVLTFVTTDDDPNFKTEWINNNVICLNHYYKIRNPNYNHYLNIANFICSPLEYVIPCYSLIQKEEKDVKQIEICVIGGGNIYTNNYHIINRMTANSPITINVIGRNINYNSISQLSSNFTVNIYEALDTTEMFNLLKKASYILINYNTNEDHNNGKSSSGSIQVAISSLCKVIISHGTNRIFKIKNALEFDLNSNEIIFLDAISDFTEIQKERDEYIDKFDKYVHNVLKCGDNDNDLPKDIRIPKTIMQTWEHKNLGWEFQKIINSWKTLNPNYEYYLFDKYERVEFIKTHFETDVLETYNSITAGAHKADLFRYCYLYICGGVYVDIDSLCLGKLDDFLLPNVDFVVPIDFNQTIGEGEHNLACGFIASKPKHSILLNCINRIVYNIKSNIILQSRLDFTGPGLLGRLTNIYLKNNETASFVGKDGIIDNIHFLKFEHFTEFIKDTNEKILFQNKNGNPHIIRLYNAECEKLHNYVSWVSCPHNNLFQEPKQIIQEPKHIALMVYGQFRSYKQNMINNLHMLEPILKSHIVHVFILTDKLMSGNYSIENEAEILSIFKDYNYNVEIDYIENYDINEEKAFENMFIDSVQQKQGVVDDFVPNLIYRKYVLNKIKNSYFLNNNITVDLNVFCRLFDIVIKNTTGTEKIANEVNKIYKNTNIILGSADTVFIGSQESMDYLLNIVEYYKQNNLYDNTIWNDPNFFNFSLVTDFPLTNSRCTYSPEIQYLAHIYYSKYAYKNIRSNFCLLLSDTNTNTITNLNSNLDMYKIFLCPNRTQFNNLENISVFNLTRNNINTVANKMPNTFIDFYTQQGKIDYSQGIGREHYKLLSCISQQIKNGTIVDIGTHHGNSTVSLGYSLFLNNNVDIYTFDIKEMAQPSCKDFFSRYSVKYCLENIFDVEIRNKYKDVLLSSKLIMIDIDPHNGILEYEMYKWLEENNYQGFILYDDIFIEKGHLANNYDKTEHNMIEFWNKIPVENKINLTNIGHWSGTGLVSFNFNKNLFILD